MLKRKGHCFVLFLSIAILTSFANSQAQDASARTLTDKDLLVIYGAIVRANYQNRSTIGTNTPEFIELEVELERRGLLNAKSYVEIERGLINLRVPLLQLYAVIDGLREVELVSFPPYTLQKFQGSEVPDPRSSERRKFIPTVLACDGKLIGFSVSGLTTIDTYYTVEQSNSTAQTNFQSGFLDPSSLYMRPWLERGRIWKSRQHIAIGANGHRHYIFEVSKTNSSLQSLVAEGVQRGQFQQLRRYFDSVC